MTKILVCSPPLSAVGGIARHSALLRDHLPGAQIFDQWWPLADRGNNRVTRLTVHGLALTRFAVRLVLSRPDWVHLQVSQPGLRRDVVYARCANLLGVPVVSHLHSEFLTNELPDLAPLLRVSRRVVALSTEIGERVVGAFPHVEDKVTVIPNPIAPAFLADLPDPPSDRVTRIAMVGVISPLKNQLSVARVVLQLRAEGHPIELTIVGPPAPEMPIDEVNFLVHADGVVLQGKRDEAEIIAELDDSSALVLFSMSEGEPLVVLEAMARGLPIISSDVGSVRTLLPEAELNVLVPVGDEASLKEALISLMARPREARLSGLANREWVTRERSLSRHLAQLIRVYAG